MLICDAIDIDWNVYWNNRINVLSANLKSTYEEVLLKLDVF